MMQKYILYACQQQKGCQAARMEKKRKNEAQKYKTLVYLFSE